MVTIKNVAIVGASGRLGKPVLDSLVSSGKFNVTVVTRESSQAKFPASVKIVRANYDSVESVTAAFKGQDAVISAVGMEGIEGQTLIIDAAIAAGVKRFLPSEFGSNTSIPKIAALPVFKYKVATRKYLEEKVAQGSGLTYTCVIHGPFLDMGIEVGFILDWKNGTPTIYDGGDQLFSATSLASAGQAVVGVLSHYEETKNRDVFVQDIATSQNRILEIAKRITPKKQWVPTNAQLSEIEKSSNESLARGEATGPAMFGYILLSIFGEGYGGLFKENDNELLGISGKTDADIEAILKPLLADGK